jgi:hypothetical protein
VIEDGKMVYGLVRTQLRGTKRGRRASKGLGIDEPMLG